MQKNSVTMARPMSIQSPSNGSLLKYADSHLISEHNCYEAWGISSQLWSTVPAVSTPRFLLTPSPVAEGWKKEQRAPGGHWARTVQQQGKYWCVFVTSLNSTVWIDVRKTICISVKPSTFCVDILEFAFSPPFHLFPF